MKKNIIFICIACLFCSGCKDKNINYSQNINNSSLDGTELRELEKIAKVAGTNLNDIKVVKKNDNEFLKFIHANYYIAVKIENKKITGLYIYDKNIKNLNIIKNLLDLKTLVLINCKISKIEGLDKLINLKKVDLGFNEISKIEGLDKLINLNELYLNYNNISKIDGLNNLLKKLPLLKKFDLYSNPLDYKSTYEIIQHREIDFGFQYNFQ